MASLMFCLDDGEEHMIEVRAAETADRSHRLVVSSLVTRTAHTQACPWQCDQLPFGPVSSLAHEVSPGQLYP